MVCLEAINITKNYRVGDNDISILKNLSFKIQCGEFVGIVGPSGSGKTTLLYVLSGLEEVTTGNVRLLDKSLIECKKDELLDIRKEEIGFIFQFYNLLPNLTVYENVLLAIVLANKHDYSEIDSVLSKVKMLEYKDYYPNQLSGGMQQRVAIARAIINRPKIIFADEPTGNLDTKTGVEIMDLLRQLNLEMNITFIMVTHNEENLQYCSRKIELLDGVIQSDDLLQV